MILEEDNAQGEKASPGASRPKEKVQNWPADSGIEVPYSQSDWVRENYRRLLWREYALT